MPATCDTCAEKVNRNYYYFLFRGRIIIVLQKSTVLHFPRAMCVILLNCFGCVLRYSWRRLRMHSFVEIGSYSWRWLSRKRNRRFPCMHMNNSHVSHGLYRVAQKNGASLSHCKYSENSMTELCRNW